MWRPSHGFVLLAIVHVASSFLFSSLPGCKCPPVSESTPGYSEVLYTPSNAGVINPERGALVLLISFSSKREPLKASTLNWHRKTKNIDIIWRQWYLDSFFTSDISTSFLNHIEEDFKALREAGFKAVLRFAYTDKQSADVTDASLKQMLAHIAQLKPYLQENEDVILSVQMGFIGVWGEWYYTHNFGNKDSISKADVENRKTVVRALLKAVPKSRSLQIRYLAAKKSMTGQSAAVTAADYRTRSSAASRIGHHNDCFLASSKDMGTYLDKAKDYPYLSEDTKYVPMGGETCKVNSPRSKCATAKKELKRFHWTYLNLAYNEDVLNGWKKEGCMDEILRNLGYRLRLIKAVLPDSTNSGSEACFLVEFENVGYAAPINPRHVKLVLRSSATYTSQHIRQFSDAEPWLPESGRISVSFSLSLNVPAGKYEVLLEFSDPLPSLSGNPDYSILLLNSGVPESNTGLNSLQRYITVTPTSGSSPSNCPGFSSRRVGKHSSSERCYSRCQDMKLGATSKNTPKAKSVTSKPASSGPLPSTTSDCSKNLLKNPSLEKVKDFYTVGKVVLSSSKVLHGSYSFKLDCRKGGFYQTVKFSSSDHVRKLTASLWSRRNSVKQPKNRSDYSLYLDLKLSDGSHLYGQNTPFDASVDGWQRSLVNVSAKKDVVQVDVWGLCRNTEGSAYFDDIGLFVSPVSCN